MAQKQKPIELTGTELAEISKIPHALGRNVYIYTGTICRPFGAALLSLPSFRPSPGSRPLSANDFGLQRRDHWTGTWYEYTYVDPETGGEAPLDYEYGMLLCDAHCDVTLDVVGVECSKYPARGWIILFYVRAGSSGVPETTWHR